jgi:hypothetical protein
MLTMLTVLTVLTMLTVLIMLTVRCLEWACTKKWTRRFEAVNELVRSPTHRTACDAFFLRVRCCARIYENCKLDLNLGFLPVWFTFCLAYCLVHFLSGSLRDWFSVSSSHGAHVQRVIDTMTCCPHDIGFPSTAARVVSYI